MGIAAIVLLGLAAALLVAHLLLLRGFERRTARAVAAVRAAPAAETVGAVLPPLLRDYLTRANVTAAAAPRWVRLEQEGEMRLKPDGDWMAFRAVQHDAVTEVAFVWRAQTKMGGLPVAVVDSFEGTKGRLEARVLGSLPVASASGADTAKGQLMRYLGELPWVPAAFATNRRLTWEPLDARRVRGLAEAGGTRGAVVFEFDGNGDIVRVRAEDRPLDGVPTPWGGDFSGYAELGGIRLPTRAVVWWDLPEGRFEYWRGRISAVTVH